MPAAPSGSSGLLAAARTLGDSLLGLLQDRLELFAVELQEEKFRLIHTFIWISAALFAAMMTIMLASLTVVYLFWESARLAVLAGLTGLYGAALVAIIVALRRYLARQPSPFAASRQEMTEDRACIRGNS